jgi:site-specific DNA-methyltransferase (adenine-specific)
MTIDVGEVAMAYMKDIVVGPRVREEMGDLDGIEDSMKEFGLIQPLAVQRLADGKYKLLAGGRRLAVLIKNDVTTVPVRIYPKDISDYEIKSIELAENFWRKDLEYWEHDNLVRETHELQQKLHGAPTYPGGSGHRMEDTGDMIGVTKNTVSDAIQRANARDAYPELFEHTKSQGDATKVMQKMDEWAVKQQIATRLEASKSDSKVNQLSKCFILGDFFERVKELPDGVFHLVEIDPPYAIDLNKAKKTDGESRYTESEYNEVANEDYMVFLNNTFQECYRVMADHSWLLCWFAPEPWAEKVYKALRNAGFETTRLCPIWTKPSGQSKRPEMHLPNSYEKFYYAWKGRPAIAKARGGNQFDYAPVPSQKKTHPTERPVELMKDIYQTFAFPGSRILIPFLGSGSGLIAADELGMSPIGFELGKSYRDSFLVKVHNMQGG